MPTVLLVNGFQVLIFYRDHDPEHVHVRRAGHEVKIAIGRTRTDDDAGVPPRILNVKGMSKQDARKAWEIVAENQALLLAEWRRLQP